MPIDIVKKNKKNSENINLKRRMVLAQENKKSFEERLEKRFSHLPKLAHRQKLKVIWSTVIFFSGVIVVFWFYLASRGVFFNKLTDNQEKDGLIKLSEIAAGFSKLKDVSANKISDKTNVILNLKNQLEAASAKNEIINSLKDDLISMPVDSDLDSSKWKEYKNTAGGFSFKYPDELNESEESGQIVFRGQDPDGFSFYFFTIEPQIDNLDKWVKESSINSEEDVVNYENKDFGDVALGVYYEAESGKDGDLKIQDGENIQRSFGYIFNHYGATYSFRTNNKNFQNTFNDILSSIKFNSIGEEQD